MNMTIRQATIFDITIIADLWQKMIEEIETEEFQKEQFFLETLSAIINPSHYVVIAEVDGVAIGFISGYIGNMDYMKKPCGIYKYLYVLPQFRGQGYHENLIESFAEFCKGKTELLAFMCFPEKSSYWEKRGYKPYKVFMIKEV